MKRWTLTTVVLVACFMLVRLIVRHGHPAEEQARDEPASGGALSAPVIPDRGDARAAPVEADPAEAAAADAAASSAPDGGTDARPDDPAMTRLHAELLGMRAPTRDALLRVAIRDAQFPCETVNSASALPDLPLWRVSCAGAHFYLVRIDELQDMHVEPILWDAIVPPGVRTLEIVPAPEREQ